MGFLGKLIAGKVIAKAVTKVKQREVAAQAAMRAQQGQYIPAGANVMTETTLAGKAVGFYERNPKLVAGAATLLMAALAAGLSKGRKLR
jgi:hypothetical protein